MKKDGKLFLGVSVSALSLGGVFLGMGRVLNGVQSPPRDGGSLTAHLIDPAGCATL